MRDRSLSSDLQEVHLSLGFIAAIDDWPYRKRSSGRGGSLSIPEELQAIWEPLLEHLDVTFEDFSSALIWTMLDVLAAWSESQSTFATANDTGPR